jgi:hypothetical protein
VDVDSNITYQDGRTARIQTRLAIESLQTGE